MILIWSLCVVSSLVWNIIKTNDQALKSAELSARNSLNRDQALRSWFVKNGGAYIKISNDIQPIAAIKHHPNRDVADIDKGYFYTLYDPQTMLKRMMEEYPDLYNTKVRLIGNHPLNIDNIPDKHEQKVLLKMQQGLESSSEIKKVNGHEFLQVMYPLWAKTGCLVCHIKNIKYGDLIGSGGVQIDMAPFLVAANHTIHNLVISHSLIWVLGLMGIIIFYRQVKFWIDSHLELQDQLLQSQANLELRVEKRTRDLNKLSVAVESSPAIILIIDRNNKIEYVNPVFTKVSGFEKEEVIGKSPAILTSNLNNRKIYIAMLKELNKKGVWHGEFCNRRKDGSTYWVSSAISTIFSETGQVQNYIAIQEDITENKLIQQELINAKESAEKSNQAKSEFLSSMSHELRTPLNAILGFAELFEFDKSLDLKYKNNARKIYNAGEYLLSLVNEILDLSKIDSGKISITRELISPLKLIDECIKLITPLVKEKNISVNFRKYPCDCRIYADYMRTKQVLLNLLSNAIKYNTKNGIINIFNHNCEKGNMKISITDSGIGIDIEKQKQLFEPFNRLGAEQSNIEGTGVGLFISKQLIDMMNGKIGVYGNQESGTTFWIQLPVHTPIQVYIDKSKNVKSHDSGAINSHILYLDNNKSSIQLMKQILEKKLNIKLLLANTLEQGISILSKIKDDDLQNITLIIADIDSLGENCIQELLVLQKQNNIVELPVFAIGGSSNINIQHKKIEYISKPVNIIKFISKITDVFGKEV